MIPALDRCLLIQMLMLPVSGPQERNSREFFNVDRSLLAAFSMPDL